ncbi:MAG: hypothetical protein ABIJ91_02100 [Candidatus Kuenenbacteria bacterium]
MDKIKVSIMFVDLRTISTKKGLPLAGDRLAVLHTTHAGSNLPACHRLEG